MEDFGRHWATGAEWGRAGPELRFGTAKPRSRPLHLPVASLPAPPAEPCPLIGQRSPRARPAEDVYCADADT